MGKQVTGKLKNVMISYFRAEEGMCKEQKSKLNDDPISRQDAIEAMWKALYTYEDLTEKQFMEHEELKLEDWFQHRIFVQRMHEECMKSVESLPPVEPERPKRTETMMVNGEPTEIDPLSYEVGYSHGQSERPRGEWLKVPDRETVYACDQCGCEPYYFGDINTIKFCPNCGSRMCREDGEA